MGEVLQANAHGRGNMHAGTSVKQKLTALTEKLKYTPVYNFYELISSTASCTSASFDGILMRCKVGILTRGGEPSRASRSEILVGKGFTPGKR